MSTRIDSLTERWRWINGYEGKYLVSNLGRVFSAPSSVHLDGYVLKQSVGRNGYLTVHLRKQGGEKRISVHRLVAEAFLPNVDGKPEVNHKDGDKQNNCVDNLEWVTTSENKTHSIRVLGNPKPPRKTISTTRKLTDDQAQAIRLDSRTQATIAEEYGVSQMVVSLIKRGKTYKVRKS